MISDSLIKNFSACCDCISSMHEFDLVQEIRRKLDKHIALKLQQAAIGTTQTSQKETFLRALEEKAHIEAKLQMQCLELEKKLVQGRCQLRTKTTRLDHRDAELAIRRAEKEQKLTLNAKAHIQANIEEIDYIYKNDKQSLVDDSQKYISSISTDIPKFSP